MDEDLDDIREKKRKELEQQAEAEEEQVEQQKQQIKEEAAQYLTKEAKSRLGNIRAARPEFASSIEAQIARLGRAGQIKELNDDQLKDILKSVQNEEKDTDIKFRR